MRCLRHLNNRKGAVAPLVAIMLIVIVICVALVVDLGHVHNVKVQMQGAVDAAALAAAQQLPGGNAAGVAVAVGAANKVDQGGVIIHSADVVTGTWDETITPGKTAFDRFLCPPPVGVAPNAVKVTAAHNVKHAFFFFTESTPVLADAIAVNRQGPGVASRFILDEEMFDTDVPAIEDLADSLGKTPEWLLTDNNGDWFIDLPPGTILELPTGQQGDEGIFDVGHPEFPFSRVSDPSFADFLNYNECGCLRDDPDVKDLLDPLLGVSRVPEIIEGESMPDYNQRARDLYEAFVSSQVQVSPIFKSDVSALNPVDGVPAVNALGWRRGLLAYKIIEVGDDPDGPSGSKLPNLRIEIVDPALIDIDQVPSSGAVKVVLVE